jgi:excisionase family DNA binding protein
MDNRFLTIGELADALGVSRSWLYQQVERDRIPHYRLGRAIRFDDAQVREWLHETSYGPSTDSKKRGGE